MSAYSDALVAMLNDFVHRGVTITLPGSLYYGLSTTQPANDGSNVTEPTDPNYARQAVTRATGSFTATSGRDTPSAVDISWPAADSGGTGYGAVQWIPVYTSGTVGSGTFLGYLTLDSVQALGAGDGFDLPAGTATWSSAA